MACHTVICITPVKRRAISNPEHIRLLQVRFLVPLALPMRTCSHSRSLSNGLLCAQNSSQTNLREKVQLLRSVPTYATYSDASIDLMAKHCRRQYFKQLDRIVLQGDDPDKVCYIVKGQCRVIKNLNTPVEKTLNLLGRGSCFGDTYAVTGIKSEFSVVSVVSSSECALLAAR